MVNFGFYVISNIISSTIAITDNINNTFITIKAITTL